MYRAAVLTGQKTIELQSRNDLIPQENEVLIRMAYAGVCGTDIALYTGDYQVPLPLVIGHEFSGYVEKIGAGVEATLLGKAVVAEINNTCITYRKKDVCPACQKMLYNHCMKKTTVGIYRHDGAFADYVIVPIGSVHMLPDSISLKEAVFVEPIAAAFRTFEMTPVREAEIIVVLGTGRLGRFVCAVAKEFNTQVIAVVRHEKHIQPALDYGAQQVICTIQQDPVKEIMRLTDGLGADLVVETTGNPEGFALAQNLVRPQGTISLKTTCGLLSTGFDETKLVVNEVRIQGSRCGPFKKAIKYMSQKKIDLNALIGDILPLEQTADAIELASSKPKVLIQGKL